MNSVRVNALLVLLSCFLVTCKQKEKVPPAEVYLLEQMDYAQLQNQVQQDLNKISDSATFFGFNLNFSDTLKLVFRNNKFSESWLKKLIKDQWLNHLVKSTEKAHFHGLDAYYYHYGFIKNITEKLERNHLDSGEKINYPQISRLIILSADATLGLYHDLSCGRVDPGYTGSVDVLPRRSCGDLTGLLINDSTEKAVYNAFPDFYPYDRLQAEYQKVLFLTDSSETGVFKLEKTALPGDTLLKGQLLWISHKLKLLGYKNWPDSTVKNEIIFKEIYSNEIKRFRISQDLKANGNLDQEVVDLLNVSRKTMLVRLKANLERWRWLGPVTESSRIWANIAENRVYAWKNDTLKLEMNTCSGTNRNAEYYRKLKLSQENGSNVLPPDNLETPLLKAKLTHFVVNPTWFVPHLIAIKEILPQIKRNPGVLASYDYVLKNRAGDIVNPWAVDWNAVGPRNFPFSIEQLAGEENSLGKVVIHFPNAYSIYMHDTNYRWVFGLSDRHISHGCIRMEKPFDMVAFITSFHKKDNYDDVLISAGMEPVRDKKLQKEWRKSKADSIADSKFAKTENKYFRAETNIPVYLVYFTCFITKMNAVKYIGDKYQRDEKMIREMQKPAPKRFKKIVVKSE